MGDVEKAIATGLVTLVVGFVLLQAQLGGTRRRQRREMLEELELLEKLDSLRYPEAQERLRLRVEVLLSRYEPDRTDESVGDPKWISRVLFGVAMVLAGVIASVLPSQDPLTLAGVGLISGASVAVVAAMVRARSRLRDVDAAVSEELRGSTSLADRAHIDTDGVVGESKAPPAGGDA